MRGELFQRGWQTWNDVMLEAAEHRDARSRQALHPRSHFDRIDGWNP